MTTKEFLVLSSREQDAIVAEKVMGWRKIERGELKGQLEMPCKDGYCWFSLPHFSTDIAAAWEVAEALGLAAIPPPDKTWSWAPAVPLAICLTALKIVGELEE